MKYKLHRINNHTQKSFGKYVAKAQHYNTITPAQLQEEIQSNCSATVADCTLVLAELSKVLAQHLQEGNRVELPYLGTVRLEILSSAVDTPEEFDVRKHVKGVRVHILPKSKDGSIGLYEGIKLEKAK